MGTPPEKKKTVMCQFDSFCKTVLRNAACDCHREFSRIREKEISYCDLNEAEWSRLSAEDQYFQEERIFQVLDIPVIVQDTVLADALDSLQDRSRTVVILYYLLGMTDLAIAGHLNLQRRNVGCIRSEALKQLKRYLIEMGDER